MAKTERQSVNEGGGQGSESLLDRPTDRPTALASAAAATRFLSRVATLDAKHIAPIGFAQVPIGVGHTIIYCHTRATHR